MNAATTAVTDAAKLDAARVLLTSLGISVTDLANAPENRPPVPTFAEYIPKITDAVGEGTRRNYGTYWNRILTRWGHRRLDEPTPTEIELLAQEIRATALVRRNSRGGRSAAEHLIAALRCLFRHAETDGLIPTGSNPALKVPKPRRLPSTRCAVANDRLAEINHIAATTGNDPELDTLLLRLHTETACRRSGALALRPQDLDETQCLIYLREKGETARWQPVSPTLMRALIRHAQQRGAPKDGQLLRYTSGRPITRRRYDHLWTRIGKHLPWAAAQQVSIHWLRHTTLTWVERTFGYGIAHAFAGHTDEAGDTGSTTTYIRGQLHEIAAALSTLTGEQHPLALVA
ncbi:site-specific integrase [Crossiella sp. SN42]|uniref:tyrosine-type recombinase/integrase n=1 Tax=Crossiella sp. SN42 TaxID=2944808 RepID=UPI00207C4B41|nr:site-specific integrase [Crossiella sp. SN42]MCO1575217.1 site-specific integrase [Crossiella sp. SN42]